MLLAAPCEKSRQEVGHFLAAAQDLVEDGEQFGKVGSVMLALVSQVCPAARATAWRARVDDSAQLCEGRRQPDHIA